ncbi:hypothetical protein AB0J47_38715 [Nocardia sp. NPDC049737]|uniref:hypothetical protein n=1 Tax=Nocardia sp. NPDC049737 TaxID=3154358 RepID=UPI00341E73AB
MGLAHTTPHSRLVVISDTPLMINEVPHVIADTSVILDGAQPLSYRGQRTSVPPVV